MARIRTIKPEFWTSEQVMECSAMARLLFIGIWNFCDDAGNHPMSPKTIKALVFPGDDITALAVEGLLAELVSNRLITIYEAASKQYLHVNGWHHQKIDRPTVKHPEFVEPSQSARREVGEGSSSGDRDLTPGREGKGSKTHSPREPFAMFLDWIPDQVQLEAYAKRSGVAIEEFSEKAISGFVVHHDAKGLAKTESQWIADLVGWRKRDLANAAKVVPLRAGPGGQQLDDSDTSWIEQGSAQ
ncbi:DnaT-like ssDNA-binding domain-containing protein [Pseudomonas sp. Irchel s3f19]|uniref:DnaT-like ssDNA-binding domain-containing protein n=1 Tax=Pseudomonas sp. Irchel s3f19 TaxID=2009146 RepID=UPI000BA39A8A|nr:DnaT-like ssDNA-binding domain-containing protein [Pseudomonas sp. Irchel s3f19]